MCPESRPEAVGLTQEWGLPQFHGRLLLLHKAVVPGGSSACDLGVALEQSMDYPSHMHVVVTIHPAALSRLGIRMLIGLDLS